MSGHRKSMENASGSSSSGTINLQPSSFSRFQDIEVPLGGTTELNDDAKEKSLRRRSLLDERAARRRSLLSESDRRTSGNFAGAGSKLRPSGSSSLLGVVESHQAPLPSLLKVSADSFEQWLKLATDNKINANNSWNFALIDYFHEMSLLREGDSINFQKASCTLDGCVKIYTSRVDSVATETTKLLGGLATSARGNEGEAGDQDDDDEQDKPAKKKHASRSGNTLAKDFSVLSLDKFNLEFSVDPLFKKTSADFDEGGARGLLLNHLNVDAEGKIIFDAGDARDDGDDEEESDEEEEKTEEDKLEDDVKDNEKSAGTKKSKKTSAEPTMLDIQRLRYKFLPSLNQIFYKDICPSLKDFQLSGSSEMDLSFLKRPQDDEDDEDGNANNNDDGDPVPDNDFGGSDAGGDFDHGGDMDVDYSQGDGEFLAPKVEEQEVPEVFDAFEDLDEQIASQRVGPAIDNNFLVDTDEIAIKGHPDMYSYFDSALLRNWAGPEHWKLRRIPKEKTAVVAIAEGATPAEEEAGSGPKKRGTKAPQVINFMDAEEIDENELFAPADPSTLTFTASTEAENRKSTHVFPDDIHFSSKQLLRMFTKPTLIIKSKTRRQQPGYLQQNQESESFNLAFPDEEFWASHTNNVDDDVAALTDQLDQTQIYNDFIEDDEDDYGFQEQGFFAGVGGETLGAGTMGELGLGLDGDGNDYASQLVSQPKRVKANFISFSKTAKKVDVKKLKDNIWKEMTQQSLKRQAAGDDLDKGRSKKKANLDGEGAEEDEESAENAKEGGQEDEDGEDYVKKEQRFTEIIGGLNKMYPEQKLRDISVPFCFICLLHLANEKNLSIEGTENLSELLIKQS